MEGTHRGFRALQRFRSRAHLALPVLQKCHTDACMSILQECVECIGNHYVQNINSTRSEIFCYIFCEVTNCLEPHQYSRYSVSICACQEWKNHGSLNKPCFISINKNLPVSVFLFMNNTYTGYKYVLICTSLHFIKK